MNGTQLVQQKRSFKKVLPILSLWLMSFFLIGFVIVSQTRLCECLSESLGGIRYVLFMKGLALHHGELVLIEGHQEDHVGDLKKWPYTKRILGLPGDQILHTKQGIKIKSIRKDEQTCFSKTLFPLPKTSKDKPLTPLSSSVVPEGYIFVSGNNPNSFDSRYEEFGLVPIEKIWGKGVATW